MKPEQIRRFLRAEPFNPSRVKVNDGRSFLVRDPLAVMVTRTYVLIGNQKKIGELPDGYVSLSPAEILEVVPVRRKRIGKVNRKARD